MRSKLLFFDIDGTLIDFQGNMPQSTVEALKAAAANGHKILLCTGRSKCQLYTKLMDCGFDGMVAASGAYIEYRGSIVRNVKMTERHVEILTDYFHKKGIFYMFQCTDRLITTPVCSAALKKIYPILDMEEYEDVMEAYPYCHVEKAVCYDPKGRLAKTKNALKDHFDVTAMSYKASGDRGAEIMVKGINKASGMQKLEAYLGAAKEDTIAFGDGPNDLEMMEYAGYSVAMGNALDEVKARADMVTEDILEDGIYLAMKRLGLIS